MVEGLEINGVDFGGPFRTQKEALEWMVFATGQKRAVTYTVGGLVYVNDSVDPATGEFYAQDALPKGAILHA